MKKGNSDKVEKETVWITFPGNQSGLIEKLRKVAPLDPLFDKQPKIDALDLLPYAERYKLQSDFTLVMIFRLREENDQNIQQLIQFLDKHFNELAEKLNKMKENNAISYDSLWYLCRKGAKMWKWEDGNRRQGVLIEKSQYISGWFPYLKVEVKFIKADGRKFAFETDFVKVIILSLTHERGHLSDICRSLSSPV